VERVKLAGRLVKWLRVGATVLSLAGFVFAFRACSKADQPVDPVARLFEALTVGPQIGTGPQSPLDGAEEDSEFDVFGRRLFGYVYPRNYPNLEVSQSRHATALAQLEAMRQAQGLTHFDPDAPPADACGGCPAGQACLFGACRSSCGTGEFPCGGFCEFSSGEQCFCVPCGGPTDAGSGGGGPGAPGCGWTPSGPTNIPGRVTAIQFDPGDANRMFAGSVGGLWASADRGRRWNRVRLGSTSRVVGDIAFNGSTREIFVAMSDVQYSGAGDGLWMSSNGDSDSFTRVSDATINGQRINRVIAQSGTNGDVYVATTGGVYVGTRPSGTFTWARLDSMDALIDDMEIDLNSSPPTVYAGVTGASGSFAIGVWRHTSTGWAKRDTGITLGTTVVRISLTMVTTSPLTLYTKIAPNNNAFAAYKTIDGGGNWTSLPNASAMNQVDQNYTWYNFFIMADPNNASVAYMGGIDLWRTTDGGTTWNNISPGADTGSAYIHGDQHSMAFDPSNSRIVYAGNDGGIWKSSDSSVATWRWTPWAHGMANTEFYRATGQLATASLAAGGSQDNGTEITFGNSTWYQPGGCDGADVASDASTSSTLYSHCNGGMFEVINPVPYTPGGGTAICRSQNPGPTCCVRDSLDRCNGACVACWSFPAGITDKTTDVGKPTKMVSDPTIGGTALMRGVNTADSTERLLKTTDGINWTSILTASAQTTAIAIAATATNPKYYYVGGLDSSSAVKVFVSSNSGAAFTTTTPSTLGRVNAIAIDSATPTHAWAASGTPGAIAQTLDGGGTWNLLTAVDAAHTMPAAASVNAIAIDAPSNRLFAGTDVGVFVGTLSGTTVSWTPYDDGLPSNTDVNDMFFNPQTSTLTIGTWGLGSFKRNINKTTCPSVELLVRDTVFDQGTAPTPSGLPDPEHPIQDTARPPFYKPDDTDGGRVYFWESTDIRVDVPSLYSGAYQFTSVDSVEFDSCPASITSCPPWVLTNVDPRRGQTANVYVQVHNQGLSSANNVRVVAMYADASAGVPPLPANFWTATAVPGQTNCGTLDESTGWHMVGCGVVSQVNQRIPEVQKFSWNVPTTTAEHTCMLSIVDSADDPITNTTTDVEALTINDRRVAHRNLHVIDGPSGPAPGSGGPGAGGSKAPGVPFSGLTTLFVPNRWNPANTHRVLLSRSGMESTGRLAFLLPNGVAGNTPGLPPKCGVPSTTPGAVTITLPKGLVTEGAALEANGTIQLADRTTVVDARGTLAPVANAGTGEVHVGVSGQVGSISGRGNVSLADRSTVDGNVTYQGQLSRGNNVTITGSTQQTTSLSPTDSVSFVVTYPATSRGDRTVNSGQFLTEVPGRLGVIQVNSGGRLRLASGTYYLEALRIESQAILELDQTLGPTIIHTRQGFTFRGTERMASGNAQPDVMLVALGSNDVSIETPFIGTVVAPAAIVTLGGGTGRYIGTFFGREVWVRPDIVVEQRLSKAFGGLPACRVLTPAEKSKAIAAGLSPDLYPVADVQLFQNWPIPFGQRWNIGLRYDSGQGRTGTAGRFRVISLLGNQVKGGNTFLLRQ